MFHVEQSDLFAVLDYKSGVLKYDCYSKVGQHSTCSLNYIKECRQANYNEYQDLLKELISIGYKVEVCNNQEVQGHRPPTKSEIKFGMGATHYKNFYLKILVKPDGTLKSKIKCKIDNLIYSFK